MADSPFVRPKLRPAAEPSALAAPAPVATASEQSAHPAAAAFADMLAASNAAAIQSAYDALVAACFVTSKPPTWASLASLLPTLRSAVPHRAKQLLSVLEARTALPQYASSSAKQAGLQSKALNVVMIGSGPVGLRCAIELALLGCRVEIFEARSSFTRLQVLHLWEWVEADLIELGIKFVDPSIFTASDLRRCSTCQLQHSLLKVALLLGVHIKFKCKVDSVGFVCARRVDVLVDASGARCELLDALGFSQTVALKSARALCIVLSLVNNKTKEELELRESTWSQQFYQEEFAELQHEGVVLENLVYYRSTGHFAEVATHYFVLTTTADALEAFGALRRGVLEQSATGDNLCAPSNVDAAKAEAYARRAVQAFVPSLANEPMVPGNLSLFDFSERKQSNRAAIAVPGDRLGGRQESVCVVTRVGDALQEPFWPEGLGINRGFLGVLDCADLVQRAATLLLTPLGKAPATLDAFAPHIARREDLYAFTKRLSAANRLTELKSHHDGSRKLKYAIDPTSRYASWRGGSTSGGGGMAALSAAPSRPRMAFHTSPRAAIPPPPKPAVTLSEVDGLLSNATSLLQSGR